MFGISQELLWIVLFNVLKSFMNLTVQFFFGIIINGEAYYESVSHLLIMTSYYRLSDSFFNVENLELGTLYNFLGNFLA